MKLDKLELEGLRQAVQRTTKKPIDGYRVWVEYLDEEYKYGFSDVVKCYKLAFVFGDKRLDITLNKDDLDVKKVSKQIGRMVKKINKEV